MMIWRQELGRRPHPLDRDPGEEGHGGDLGRRGEEGGDRSRRALVDVRGPHVERHGADLEGQARQDEYDAEQGAGAEPFRARHLRADRLGDAAEQGGAGEAVKERDAVKQDAARQRAQHEIFEAGLGGAGVAALERGKDVGGEALQLEADIEGEEVAGRDHHAHADRRKQDQHRIFGAEVAVAAEPAHRRQHRDRGGEVDDDLRKGREAVADEQAVESGAAGVAEAGHEGGGDGEGEHAEPGQERARAVAGPGRGQHQREAGEGEDQLRRDDDEIVSHDRLTVIPAKERLTVIPAKAGISFFLAEAKQEGRSRLSPG